MNLLAVASPFPRDALRLRFRWGIKSARSVGGTDGALRTRKSGVTAVRGSGDCGDGITSHANSSGLESDASHLQEVAKPDRSTVPPAVPWPSSLRDEHIRMPAPREALCPSCQGSSAADWSLQAVRRRRIQQLAG